MEKGYIGNSRSVRSQEAINNYEVPISMINKSLVQEYLEDNPDEFSPLQIEKLRTYSIAKWRYVAKIRVFPSSWHHTSKMYNKTDHYCLETIAKYMLDHPDFVVSFQYYNETPENPIAKYGVIKVQMWGGSRKYPKLEGYSEVAGIVIGDWLYYVSGNGISRLKTDANKVESFYCYDSYAELVKHHKDYKGTVKTFNALLKVKEN